MQVILLLLIIVIIVIYKLLALVIFDILLISDLQGAVKPFSSAHVMLLIKQFNALSGLTLQLLWLVSRIFLRGFLLLVLLYIFFRLP